MSQAFAKAFIENLAGTATLNPTLLNTLSGVLANQVIVAGDGSVTFGPAFDILAKVFTFISTTASDRPAAGAIAGYDATAVEQAKTAAAADTGTTLPGETVPTTFELTAANDQINEGESNTFTVTASQPVEEDTTVTFNLKIDGETAGLADFNAGAFNPVTVVIPAGQTEATFDVESITNDGTELTETYRVEAVVDGETLSKQVQLLDGAVGAGQTFQLTTGLDIIPGMNGSNGNTVTAGNDTIIGVLDGGAATTLNASDLINGGDGTDTLRVFASDVSITDVSELSNFSNIEILSLSSSGISGSITLDTTAQSGLEQLEVTAASKAVDLDAGTTQDVTVSGAKSNVKIDGGQDVVVNSATAGSNITIGASTQNNGTITVNDSNQGAGNIAVDGGTDVVVNNTNGTGTTTIGANKAATGTVELNTTLESDGAALAGGAISVTGGSSIDVTVDASNIADDSADAGAVAVGAIDVTGDDTTTTVNVTQNLNNQTFTKAATGQVTETASVKFGALKQGDDLTVGGLNFEAAKDLTAEEVAQAFSELTAADTQDAGGSVENGIYTTQLTGWKSAEASGDTVVFTSTTANANVGDLDLATTLTNTSGNSVAPVVATTDGAVGTAAATSANTTVAGKVDVDDNVTASITDVTLDTFGVATLGGGAALDALANLSLSNSAGATTVTSAATTLALNVDNVTNTVDLDGKAATVETLNLTAAGASKFALTSVATKNLNVTADAALNLTGSMLTALENTVVTGAGNVALGDISAASKSLDASAATGNISAIVDGTKATVTTSGGNDAITVNTATQTKDIDLGAGNDTLTYSNATISVPTGAANGGDGIDTVAMTSASAEALDANTNFATAISGFERLAITDALAASADVDLEALGFDYVTLKLGSGGAAILSNLANNGTVAIEAALAGDLTVKVKDAGTGPADELNLVVSGDSTINSAGKVIANDVETFNINANDVFVDNGSGQDLNNAVHNLTVDGDKVSSIVVTGDDLVLITNANVLASVDASAMTGGITYTANASATATTVLGGNGTDKLTALGNNDVLNGGAGNDTLTGANLTQLTGGDGADTFVVNQPSNVNTYSTITDLSSGDVIKFNGADVAFSSSAVQLAATAVFQDYANEAVNLLGADGDDAAWFQFQGDTYIVQSGNTTANDDFVNGSDSIIQITGLVDLSTASYNQTDGTLEIA